MVLYKSDYYILLYLLLLTHHRSTVDFMQY